MYPELYQKWFKLALNPTELVLIEILMKIVGLLSKATLGHLANNLPLPILAASRLKTLQRFLDSPRFCQEKLWWGIWMELMMGYWKKKAPIVLLRLHGRGTRPQRTAILAIDRTSWRKYNLLVVSWIIQGRAIPINWLLLDKLGSSNLDDQKSGINISKTAHTLPFNLAIHYPKEHHGMPIEEGWFILTTFSDLNTAVQNYATRFQLEEMFRDFKLDGFNLELTQLNGSRFDAWFLLLTLVYSVLAFTGVCATEIDEKYLVRADNTKRRSKRNSIVTFGKVALFYKFDWAFLAPLISQYIRINHHKIDCYVRGLNFYDRYLAKS